MLAYIAAESQAQLSGLVHACELPKGFCTAAPQKVGPPTQWKERQRGGVMASKLYCGVYIFIPGAGPF